MSENPLILGLDLETTGLSFEEDSVIEVGLVLWQNRQSVRLAGFLVKPDIDISPERWAEAEKVHGISRQAVDTYGKESTDAWKLICKWAWACEALIAHNGALFDKPMLEAWQGRDRGASLPAKIWIDTRTDLPIPLSGKLKYLAADHGFVNPFPHRALTDVLTMLRILDAYDLGVVLERAKIPNITVQARVSYDDRRLAADRGYYWKPDTKQWLKLIKECDLEREKAEAGFPVSVVKNL